MKHSTKEADSENDYVSADLIKEIYPDEGSSHRYSVPIIYVVDSGNHCIRKLDLTTSISSTIAG